MTMRFILCNSSLTIYSIKMNLVFLTCFLALHWLAIFTEDILSTYQISNSSVLHWLMSIGKSLFRKLSRGKTWEKMVFVLNYVQDIALNQKLCSGVSGCWAMITVSSVHIFVIPFRMITQKSSVFPLTTTGL